MEDVKEFEKWIDKMLKDSEDELHMTPETLAYFLLQRGLNYYLRSLLKNHGEKN